VSHARNKAKQLQQRNQREHDNGDCGEWLEHITLPGVRVESLHADDFLIG
jgi:hypothetical protein